MKTIEVAAVAAALLAFAYFTLNWGLEGVIHTRRTQTVPDLKSRSIAAALDQLAPLNLGLRKTGVEFDASVPISSVLRQDPPAGTVASNSTPVLRRPRFSGAS